MSFETMYGPSPRERAAAAYERAYEEIDEFRMTPADELPVSTALKVAASLDTILHEHVGIEPLTRQTSRGRVIHLENYPETGQLLNAKPSSYSEPFVEIQVWQKIPETPTSLQGLRCVRLPTKIRDEMPDLATFSGPASSPDSWKSYFPFWTEADIIAQQQAAFPDYQRQFAAITRQLCSDVLRFVRPPEQPHYILPPELATRKQWQ